MYPIQVIVLVLLASFYNRFAAQAAPAASTGLVLFRVLLGNLGLCVLVMVAARWSVRRLYRSSMDSTRAVLRFTRIMNLARWGSIGLLAWELWNGGFGPLVMQRWGLERSIFLPELIFLSVPVLDWFVYWMAQYQVDRAVHQKALPFRLAMALPVHDLPGLPRYLSLKARTNLWLLLVELLIVPTDAFLQNVGWAKAHAGAAGLLAMAVDLSTFLLIPWFITRIWVTAPMERGPLRDRLEALAAKFHIRFLDIRIWKTDHTIQNAMILGPFPFCRYFLLSDALLESLTDEQIEAVFAHEVGHGHHRHILWYLTGLWGAILCSTAVASWLRHTFPYITIFHSAQLGQVGLLAIFLVTVFTFISRQCEHQADWFAARYMAQTPAAGRPVMSEGMLQAVMMPDTLFDDQGVGGWQPVAPFSSVVTGPEIDISRGNFASTARQARAAGAGQSSAQGVGQSVGQSGAAGDAQSLRLQRGSAIFSGALFRIVELSNRTLNKGGAMHPSPLKRAAFLQNLSRSPREAQRFDRRMWQLRAAIVLFLLLGLALAWYSRTGAGRTSMAHNPAPGSARQWHPRAAGQIIERNWRTITYYA